MQQRIWDITETTESVFSYSSEEAFLESNVLDGLHSIMIGGYPLDILYRERHAETTIVTFHAAVTSQVKLPIFSGMRMTEHMEANTIFVSDPSLNLDPSLKLAWFAGNQYQDLQSILPRIVKHILDSTSGKNLIFFGASGGGFAALYYSSLFPGSLAIGVNPRTIISQSFQSSISHYMQTCWGVQEARGAENILTSSIQSDLRTSTPQPATNTVAYIQNAQDSLYIRSSLIPFLEGLEDTSHIHLLMKNWGKGHVPADRAFLIELLTLAVAYAPDWPTALDDLRFLPAPSAADIADIQRELAHRSTQSGVVANNRFAQLPAGSQGVLRQWPLNIIRPVRNGTIQLSPVTNGQLVKWGAPGAHKLYLTTFSGGFGDPPAGPGSEITKCEHDSLIRVRFSFCGSEPHPASVTLFVIQYEGKSRRITDNWRFHAGSERTTHTALVSVLSMADSFRLVFLIHSKVQSEIVFLNLQTEHF